MSPRYKNSGYGRGKSRTDALFYPPLRAGDFRQRVTIQQPTLVPDGIGGFTGGEWASEDTGWSDVQTVWAHIQSINPTVYLDEKQWRDREFITQQWFNVVIRYRNGIGTNMRLLWNNQILIIYSVVNRDVLNWQINLFCRQGG